jgi:Flp pilus assembly protein TadD
MTVTCALSAGLVLALAAVPGACRLPPGSGEIRQGVLMSESGRWDEAAARWRTALEADPSSVAAHNNLAVAYEKSGRFEEARKEYETALRLDPGNATVQENYRKFSQSRALEAGKETRKGRPPQEGSP